MPRLLPSSPRLRRRLFRIFLAVWIVGAAVLVAVLFPEYSGKTKQHFTPGAPQLVTSQPQVPVSRADRRAIDVLLDRFVPAAVGRQNPLAAYALTTPALRQIDPRAAWKRGDIAAYPLRVADTSFHGWSTQYSFRNEVNLELVVHAKPGGQFSGVAYTIDVKRLGGRWLVDSISTRGFYDAEPTQASATGGHRPSPAPAQPVPAASTLPKGHPIFLLLPVALLAIPLLGLLGWILVSWRRRRAAERSYRLAA